jgi:hypothetical protein
MADAVCAPVATRFSTYDGKLDPASAGYCQTIMALPVMGSGSNARKRSPTSSNSSTWSSSAASATPSAPRKECWATDEIELR